MCPQLPLKYGLLTTNGIFRNLSGVATDGARRGVRDGQAAGVLRRADGGRQARSPGGRLEVGSRVRTGPAGGCGAGAVVAVCGRRGGRGRRPRRPARADGRGAGGGPADRGPGRAAAEVPPAGDGCSGRPPGEGRPAGLARRGSGVPRRPPGPAGRPRPPPRPSGAARPSRPLRPGPGRGSPGRAQGRLRPDRQARMDLPGGLRDDRLQVPRRLDQDPPLLRGRSRPAPGPTARSGLGSTAHRARRPPLAARRSRASRRWHPGETWCCWRRWRGSPESAAPRW